MLDKAMRIVLELSFSAGFIILCVLVLRLLLKRAPRIFSYALWGIVLFRLLCPLSLQSPVSLFPQYPISRFFSENIGFLSSPADKSANAVQGTDTGETDIGILSAGMAVPESSIKNDVEDTVSAVSYLWAAGALILAGYGLVSLFRLRRQAACSMKLQYAGESRMAVSERIYLADNIDTPFVLGLFRPRIYLPSSLAEEEMEYVILHERHHIRRLDHAAKLLAFGALCLHWFNPLVWLAFLLAQKDMEMSCDEAVIRRMNRDVRAAYSASLLHMATGRNLLAGIPPAFGGGNPRSRIKHIMDYKKPSLWIVITAALICVAAAVFFLTDSAEAEEDPNALLLEGGRLENYDFDHDGTTDRVELEIGSLQTPWVLRVTDRSGTLLWSDEAYVQHPGWNSIFVCQAEGRDYLLRYQPVMYQGFSTYYYKVFYLINGQEILVAEDSVDFDINGGPLHESFDPAAMAAFAEGLNSWLEHGKLLMSTDEDSVIYMDPQHPQENFVGLWKMLEPSVGDYNKELSLEENLKKLAEAIESF